jgi:tetratricopeptide (TPR) repeat protein
LPGAFLFYMWQLVKKVKFHSSQTQKAGRSSRRREGSIIVGVDEKLLLNAYNQLQHIEAAMDAKLIKIKDEIVAELREELHIIFDKKVQAEQCLGKTRILYKSGQYAEALRECNSAVELSPSGVAHYIRGVLHHKLGLDEAAMVDLKTAAKLSYQKAQAFLATQNVSYQ